MAEHGESALRALGGRRAAERALAEHDPGEDVPALVASLTAEGRPVRGLAGQVVVLVAVFAAATGIAELAGAANLGTALAFGQIAFAIALVARAGQALARLRGLHHQAPGPVVQLPPGRAPAPRGTRTGARR